MQPERDLPDVLILDGPELGLHPYAINIVGGLIRAASPKVQVIVATQSTALVDCFEPEDIVVVEREGHSSTFRQRPLKNGSKTIRFPSCGKRTCLEGDRSDEKNTAPSKRIIGQIPEYERMKVSAAPIVAEKIGLPTLRLKCTHFAEWLCTLEKLNKRRTQ